MTPQRLIQTCLRVSKRLWQRRGSMVACCRVRGTECCSASMGPFEGGPILFITSTIVWPHLRPNHGGGDEDNGDLLQRSHDALLRSVPPTLQQATTDPCLCRRLLDTHRQVWVSLFWGHCSFLLGPSAHNVLFVPSKSLFPESCVSSGSSMVVLMATSSKRAYVIPRSAAPRVPAPVVGHC